MILKIKSIKLTDFKGCKNATYDLKNVNDIIGENGVGKTTIATGWYWLIADKDYGLKSNPNIRPKGDTTCVPKVKAVVDIDGKEVVIAKYQKCTVKESKTGGNDTITLTNKYQINGIDYGEKDFRKKLIDYGVDLEYALPLSHIEAFTGQKSADMRKALEPLADDISEVDIASNMENVSDVRKLLENYTLSEIKALYSGKIKELVNTYGKNASKLTEQIAGKESAKTDIDLSALELQKNALQEKREQIRKEIYNANESIRNDIGAKIIELHCELHNLEEKANNENNSKRAELQEMIHTYERTVSEITLARQQRAYNINHYNSEIEELKHQLNVAKNTRSVISERTFDENSLVCPYCKQEYADDRKAEIKAEYECQNALDLKSIEEKIDGFEKSIADLENKLRLLKNCNEQYNSELQLVESSLGLVKDQFNSLPQHIDVSGTEEYRSIQKQIDDLQNSDKSDEITADIEKLRLQQFEIEEELSSVNEKFGIAYINDKIDEQIEELKARRTQAQQEQADCERVLYQAELVGKEKNKVMADAVNSHFEIVDFKLFDYQKNGEYKEVCVPQYKGKDLSVDTNTALEIRMKLDIINGLQKFYGMYFPVFIDEGEKITATTRREIDMDCQYFYLTATSGAKLTVITAGVGGGISTVKEN